jgi:hypothetical protein
MRSGGQHGACYPNAFGRGDLMMIFFDFACRASLLAACLLIPHAAHAQPAQPKSPITHVKLWMMQRVGAPVVSPEGRWVVFQVLEPSHDQDKTQSATAK